MTVNIFAVLDKDGVVVNRILVDTDSAATYWPGYGRAMVDLGPAPAENQPPPPPGKDKNWGVLPFTIAEAVDMGDTVDLVTGAVTKKPIEITPVEEPPIEEVIV